MHSTLELSELHDHVGRLFMAGMPGPHLDAGTISLIRERGLGGVILFKRNIEDPLQVAALCNDLQETALKCHGIPLFLAVDQEGGRVARMQKPFTRFPGNSAIGHGHNSRDMAARFGRVTAMEMRLVGLNMNMAPVLDVPRLGRIVIKALQENGVMAVGKHFPGLGKARLDPHEHLPTIEADQQEIETLNLPSFQAAIREGVSAVMTSHALYPGEAGNDILLICEDQGLVRESMDKLRNRLLTNETLLSRLHESVARIMAAKEKIGSWAPVSLKEVKRYFKNKA
ncbi:MAG: hypothetical protein B6240_14505 [Desulfobacteraceae bacterium 4572_87]|nr:MAG: hypothetical protein B6240_14505 [Desulfobacteraceae bacterium 4572_87]